MSYQSLNPATGKLLKKFDELTDKELETKIATAATCFETWRKKTYAERAVIVGGPLCESGDIFTQEEGGYVATRRLLWRRR